MASSSQSNAFGHDGVLNTYAASIPKHEHFDKPIRMKTERFNNSFQHKATVIRMEWESQPNGDFLAKMAENGDGDCDHKRFTCPQKTPGGGASVYASGNHYDRLSGDPTNQHQWKESFKTKNSDRYVTYEGPFTDTNTPERIRDGLNALFPTRESSGMRGEWLVRKEMLSMAYDEAKTTGVPVKRILLDNLTELIAMSYDQEILNRTTFMLRVDDLVATYDPATKTALQSLESALRANPDKVYRFPQKVVTDGSSQLVYEFYRVKSGMTKADNGCTIPGFKHYAHRGGDGHVFIQMNAGFGYYTVEDMNLYDALKIAKGSVGSIAGCICIVKIKSLRTTPAGLPDTSDLFRTYAVKIRVDPDCPRVKKYVFDYLRNTKNLPTGWKTASNAEADAAPKYGEAPSSSRPSPPPPPVQPAPVADAPTLVAKSVEYVTVNGVPTFRVTEKQRIHDLDHDICEIATAIAYAIASKKLNGFAIDWVSRHQPATVVALGRFTLLFPFLSRARIVRA